MYTFPLTVFAACAFVAPQPLYAQDAQAPASEDQVKERKQALETLASSTDQLLELLRQVKDKESADAAAPQARTLMLQIADTLMDIGTDNWQTELEAVPELEKKLRELAAMLGTLGEESEWYGSEALARAFDLEDGWDDEEEDTGLTEVQKEVYGKATELTIECMTQVHEILSNVKDKASADAAAPKVAEIFQKLWKVFEETDSRDDFTPEVAHYLGEKYCDASQVIPACEERIRQLAAENYYGSQALKKAIEILIHL